MPWWRSIRTWNGAGRTATCAHRAVRASLLAAKPVERMGSRDVKPVIARIFIMSDPRANRLVAFPREAPIAEAYRSPPAFPGRFLP